MLKKRVSPGDVLKMKTDGYVLLDSLPKDHFHKIHIPGAENACVYEVSFLDQVNAVIPDKSGKIIVYGSSHRSQDAVVAAEKLQRAGFDNVAILEGGLEAWKKAGYTVAGDAVDALHDSGSLISLVDGTYKLDVEKSVTEWAGRNQNNKHFGTLRFNKGTLAVENGRLSGMLEVDMHSMENINLTGDDLQPVLISHLKSDDFFFVEQFPVAVYRIREGKLTEKPYATAVNCTIKGELSLRGTTADLDFEASLAKRSATVLALEAHFDMDRTRWNIIYGSSRYFEHLGMHTVFEAISLQLRCFFIMT